MHDRKNATTVPHTMIQPASETPPRPRGALHPRFSQGQFEHHRQLPSAPLAGVVEHYWHVRWDLRGLLLRGLYQVFGIKLVGLALGEYQKSLAL